MYFSELLRPAMIPKGRRPSPILKKDKETDAMRHCQDYVARQNLTENTDTRHLEQHSVTERHPNRVVLEEEHTSHQSRRAFTPGLTVADEPDHAFLVSS